MSWPAHAESEHQHGLVVLDDDDPAVLIAVVGDQANATRWTRDVGDPVSDGAEPWTTLGYGSQ